MKNCCDGIYNSFDVHFTSACDNKCSHCIDMRYGRVEESGTDLEAISNTIAANSDGYDDVLFLGGEPCLYLQKLIDCIKAVKKKSDLKIYVTTSVPKICSDKYDMFCELIGIVDGMNLSVQHYDELIADNIRRTESEYDRQALYRNLPFKEKIRINLNIVKPYLYTRQDIVRCLKYYDCIGFNEIKLSEIQHGKEHFVSFENTFGIKLESPFSGGCQSYLDMQKIIPDFKTKVLLKRSCFLCEETLKASFMDGVKTIYRFLKKPDNKYGVIYSDGQLTNGWGQRCIRGY